MMVHLSVICPKFVLISMNSKIPMGLIDDLFRFREHMAGVHGEKNFHFEHGHLQQPVVGAPPPHG